MPEMGTVTHGGCRGWTYRIAAAFGRYKAFSLQWDGSWHPGPRYLCPLLCSLMKILLTLQGSSPGFPSMETDSSSQDYLVSLSPLYLEELSVSCVTMTRVLVCLLELLEHMVCGLSILRLQLLALSIEETQYIGEPAWRFARGVSFGGLPVTSSVTSGKLLDLLEPQFPHL